MLSGPTRPANLPPLSTFFDFHISPGHQQPHHHGTSTTNPTLSLTPCLGDGPVIHLRVAACSAARRSRLRLCSARGGGRCGGTQGARGLVRPALPRRGATSAPTLPTDEADAEARMEPGRSARPPCPRWRPALPLAPAPRQTSTRLLFSTRRYGAAPPTLILRSWQCIRQPPSKVFLHQ